MIRMVLFCLVFLTPFHYKHFPLTQFLCFCKFDSFQSFCNFVYTNISEENINSARCINPLHDIEVCEGDSLDLEVTLNDRDPEVLWLHNGVVLKESRWLFMTSDGYKRQLTIDPCTKNDEGLYACVLKEGYNPEMEKVVVLTFCEVTIRDKSQPQSPREKNFEHLRTYQKLVIGVEDSLLEYVAMVTFVATLAYMLCIYFCYELLQDNFPDVFERKF